jgi:hypothetical protein
LVSVVEAERISNPDFPAVSLLNQREFDRDRESEGERDGEGERERERERKACTYSRR